MVIVSEFVESALFEAAALDEDGTAVVVVGAGSCLLQAVNRMPKATTAQIFDFIRSESFNVRSNAGQSPEQPARRQARQPPNP